MNAGTNAWSAYTAAQAETGTATVWPTAPPPTGASGETSTEGGADRGTNNVGTSGESANPNMVS